MANPGCRGVVERSLAKRPKSKHTVAKAAMKRIGFLRPKVIMSNEEYEEQLRWQEAFEKMLAKKYGKDHNTF
jgi:hypothetical protein